LSLATAAQEMDQLSSLNPRVKEPLYHMVISWLPGENPDSAEAFASVEHTLHALGFEGHQFVAAVHRDTDNVHVHVMVNRISPTSLRAVAPANDYYVMDRCMRELEIRFGRGHAPGPYVVEVRNGQTVVVRAKGSDRPEQPRPPKRPQGAERMEVFAGEESFFTYVRGEPRKAAMALLKDPHLTWEKLHQGLATYGIELRPKGRGLAVYAVGAPETTPVKGSDMHEQLSFARLEKRLGTYQSPVPPSAPKAAPVTDSYTSSRETEAVERRQPRSKRDPEQREAWRQARAKARQDLKLRYRQYRANYKSPRLSPEDVKLRFAEQRGEFKARRQAIRAGGASPIERKVLYSLLALEAAKAKTELQQRIAKERAAVRANPANRRKTYREWVEEQAQLGEEAALAQLRGWHYAEQRAGKKQQDEQAVAQQYAGMTGGLIQESAIHVTIMGITAHDVRRDGSVVYWHNDGRSFIDHGQFVRMASNRDMDEHRILAALLFSRQKYGQGFELTGTNAFKARAIEIIVKHQLDIRLRDPQQAAALRTAQAAKNPTPRPTP